MRSKQEITIDKIIRSKRRTLALVVTQDAQLVVRAPLAASEIVIRRFIHEKSVWIKKKKMAAQNQNKKIIPKQFVDGEGFLYLGASYRFKAIDGEDIALTDLLEFPKRLLPQPKKHLTEWYRVQAKTKISERVKWHADSMGLKYSAVKIGNARKRWGSCSHTHNLNFSWRLIMAPLEIVDYVVVHEIVHIEIKNHSRQFWNKIKTLMPLYKEYKRWIKNNGYLLTL